MSEYMVKYKSNNNVVFSCKFDVLHSVNEGDSFLPTPRTEDGDGSAGLKGQAADSEVFASEQALRACPAPRIFFAAFASAFSA